MTLYILTITYHYMWGLTLDLWSNDVLQALFYTFATLSIVWGNLRHNGSETLLLPLSFQVPPDTFQSKLEMVCSFGLILWRVNNIYTSLSAKNTYISYHPISEQFPTRYPKRGRGKRHIKKHLSIFVFVGTLFSCDTSPRPIWDTIIRIIT